MQTVETCEIRMEPSLLHCDLKDRARSGSPVQQSDFPDEPPDSAPPPPPPLLFWFAFLWPDLKREGTARNDGLKVFCEGRFMYMVSLEGQGRDFVVIL